MTYYTIVTYHKREPECGSRLTTDYKRFGNAMRRVAELEQTDWYHRITVYATEDLNINSAHAHIMYDAKGE